MSSMRARALGSSVPQRSAAPAVKAPPALSSPTNGPEESKRAPANPGQQVTPKSSMRDLLPRQSRNGKGFKDEHNLKYQIDIQISPKKMLVVKIYNGDRAEDILATLKMNPDLDLDEEDLVNIERVIRYHT